MGFGIHCGGPSTNPPWIPRDGCTSFLIFLTGKLKICSLKAEMFQTSQRKHKQFKAGF